MEQSELLKIVDKIKETEKIDNDSKSIERDIYDFIIRDSEKHERLFKEKIDFEKLSIELKLKNIDLILDILKFITSISISIFIASLTTNLFNEVQIVALIILNVILIIILVVLLKKRGDIIKIELRNLIEYRNKISNEIMDHQDSGVFSMFEHRIKSIKDRHKNIESRGDQLK